MRAGGLSVAVPIDAHTTRPERQLALVVRDLARRVDATERSVSRPVVLADVTDFADLVRRVEALEQALGVTPP